MPPADPNVALRPLFPSLSLAPALADVAIGAGIRAACGRRAVSECADACVTSGQCEFFIYGEGSAWGGNCHREHTSDASCPEGWQTDNYAFYSVDASAGRRRMDESITAITCEDVTTESPTSEGECMNVLPALDRRVLDLLSWSGSHCIAMLLYGYMSWHLIPHIWSWPSAESITVDQVHSRLPCG